MGSRQSSKIVIFHISFKGFGSKDSLRICFRMFSGAQFHSEPREAKLFIYHFTNVEIAMVLVRKIREKYETVRGKNEILKKYQIKYSNLTKK